VSAQPRGRTRRAEPAHLEGILVDACVPACHFAKARFEAADLVFWEKRGSFSVLGTNSSWEENISQVLDARLPQTARHHSYHAHLSCTSAHSAQFLHHDKQFFETCFHSECTAWFRNPNRAKAVHSTKLKSVLLNTCSSANRKPRDEERMWRCGAPPPPPFFFLFSQPILAFVSSYFLTANPIAMGGDPNKTLAHRPHLPLYPVCSFTNYSWSA
jgi:hypothetical protein